MNFKIFHICKMLFLHIWEKIIFAFGSKLKVLFLWDNITLDLWNQQLHNFVSIFLTFKNITYLSISKIKAILGEGFLVPKGISCKFQCFYSKTPDTGGSEVLWIMTHCQEYFLYHDPIHTRIHVEKMFWKTILLTTYEVFYLFFCPILFHFFPFWYWSWSTELISPSINGCYH